VWWKKVTLRWPSHPLPKKQRPVLEDRSHAARGNGETDHIFFGGEPSCHADPTFIAAPQDACSRRSGPGDAIVHGECSDVLRRLDHLEVRFVPVANAKGVTALPYRYPRLSVEIRNSAKVACTNGRVRLRHRAVWVE
jgi:hypothetical protein